MLFGYQNDWLGYDGTDPFTIQEYNIEPIGKDRISI